MHSYWLKFSISDSRQKLKPCAVPSKHIPETSVRIKPKAGCCVTGCPTKKRSNLFRFPTPKKQRKLNMWKDVFHIADEDNTAIFKICGKHFKDCDYAKGKKLRVQSDLLQFVEPTLGPPPFLGCFSSSEVGFLCVFGQVPKMLSIQKKTAELVEITGQLRGSVNN